MTSALIILAILAVYMIPSIITFIRLPPSPLSVMVVNVLLGWTVVGWIVALAMALRDPPPKSPWVDGGKR